MPGTITDDIEIIDAGHGGGTDVPSGGDDDGDGHGGGGLPAIPQRAYFTAIQLALAGIVMFFMALTSSFLVRKGLGDDWVSFTLPRILWANTLVLLASSGAIQFARARLRGGDTEGFRRWWGITTALGALFLVGQFAAWRQLAAQGVFLVTNPSSSFFYLLTALHGLHLLGGIVALLYVTYRPWQRSRITQSTAADLVSIYWHFMDGLWIFLFALLYLGR
jgi:cytochrome c oxidase subunit III